MRYSISLHGVNCSSSVGILLLPPYARALLSGQPLPRALRFYQRRALRILPAYWVCLTLLVLLVPWTFGGPTFLGDVLSHVVLLHDDFPPFNRDIEGPFWTLAVEAQFYVALPLLTGVLQRVMGASRSLVRLSSAVVTIMVLALMMRALDAEIMAHLPATSMTGIANVGQVFVLITMGTQGKYLEVFAEGGRRWFSMLPAPNPNCSRSSSSAVGVRRYS